MSELGGGQQLNEHYVQKGLRGIRNVMKKLGMLPGELELPERQVVVEELIVLRPHHGGLMLSEVEPSRLGEEVAQGTTLGRIVSPYTFEELETVTAPFDAVAARARTRGGHEGRSRRLRVHGRERGDRHSGLSAEPGSHERLTASVAALARHEKPAASPSRHRSSSPYLARARSAVR